MKEPTLTRMQESVSSLKKDFIEWSDALSVGVEAVSYTHLDVYKRQLRNQREACPHDGYDHQLCLSLIHI